MVEPIPGTRRIDPQPLGRLPMLDQHHALHQISQAGGKKSKSGRPMQCNASQTQIIGIIRQLFDLPHFPLMALTLGGTIISVSAPRRYIAPPPVYPDLWLSWMRLQQSADDNADAERACYLLLSLRAC